MKRALIIACAMVLIGSPVWAQVVPSYINNGPIAGPIPGGASQSNCPPGKVCPEKLPLLKPLPPPQDQPNNGGKPYCPPNAMCAQPTSQLPAHPAYQ